MTIELFLILFTFGSSVSALLTQALKKTVPNISSNIVALVDAFVVGAFGTLIFYIITDTPISVKNICWIILMSFAIWLGSVVSYDKVKQTLSQIRGDEL